MFNLLKKIKTLQLKINRIEKLIEQKESEAEFIYNNMKNEKVLIGNLLSKFNSQAINITKIQDAEFQVFSQWGDDGIIQFLVNTLKIENKTFIEFGVENYTESNTRFLLINNCWQGLVIDGSKKNIDFIQQDTICWSNQLYAKQAFITKENINLLLTDLPFDSEVGILSIDIDGNDYWVWDAINVVTPIIVIVEYNSLFGRSNAWTIPYASDFVRGDVSSENISYYGASLEAFKFLGHKKGYVFLGCNSNGNNAYFIRKDYSKKIDHLIPTDDGFVLCSFNEILKENKRVVGIDRIKALNGKKVIDVISGTEELINFSDHEIFVNHYKG